MLVHRCFYRSVGDSRHSDAGQVSLDMDIGNALRPDRDIGGEIERGLSPGSADRNH